MPIHILLFKNKINKTGLQPVSRPEEQPDRPTGLAVPLASVYYSDHDALCFLKRTPPNITGMHRDSWVSTYAKVP